MAARISSLTGALTLTVSGWTAPLKQAEKATQAFSKALGPVQRFAEDTGRVLAATGGLVGAAMLGMAKKAADFGDSLLEASQKTGISTQNLSAFKLIADQSGSSFEALSKGVGILSKNIVAAAAGSKEQAKLFSAMGIAVKDAGGNVRSTSAIMEDVADLFSKMEDGSLKTALAMKIFGKAGADLIPTLNQGSEGIRKAREQTEKYGIALTAAEAALGDKFNDSLVESKAAMQGFANAVGIALLPKLTELVDKGNDWIATAAKWTKAHPELTLAIGKTAAVIFGAGGLLLGLSGILAIAPQVYKGVMLMSTAYKSLGLAMNGVGAASIAAKAGVIGLAAAIGTAVALLPKLAIDKFLPDPVELGRRLRSIVDPSVIPNPEQPKAPGLPSNWEELSKKSASATSEWEKQIEKLLGTFDKAGNKTEKAKTQIETLWESLKKETTEAASLEAVLMRASAAHVSLDDVTDKLGGTINDVVAEMFKAGKIVLPEYIGRTYALMKQQEGLVEASKEWQAAQQKTIDLYQRELEVLQEFSKVPITDIVRDSDTQRIIDNAVALGKHRQELDRGTEVLHQQQQELRDTAAAVAALSEEGYSASQIQAALGVNLEEVDARLKDLGVTLDPVTRKLLALGKGSAILDGLRRQQDELADTADAAAALAEAGYSASQIEAALGVNLETVSKRAKDLGVQLDPLTRKTIEQVAATRKLQDSWGSTMGSMVDQLIDFGLEGDKTWKRLADIGKNTFKDLGRSFLDGLVKPLKDGLTNLGEHAAKALGNILFGGPKGAQGQQASTGGILGGLLGGIFSNNAGGQGILGNIFGGGGTGGTPPFVGGAVGQLSGLAGSLNPAMMGVSIANQGFDLVNKITGKIGAGRDSADEIVKSQNAFGDTLGSIINDSGLSATNKLKQVGNVWEAFQANLARYSATGGENAVTANQSFATIAPLVSRIQADLIKAGASDGSAGSGGNTFNIYVSDSSGSGDAIAYKVLDVIKRNLAGATEEIVRQVDLKDGAVVSR